MIFYTLEKILRDSGFQHVQKLSFNVGNDPVLLKDSGRTEASNPCMSNARNDMNFGYIPPRSAGRNTDRRLYRRGHPIATGVAQSDRDFQDAAHQRACVTETIIIFRISVASATPLLALPCFHQIARSFPNSRPRSRHGCSASTRRDIG